MRGYVPKLGFYTLFYGSCRAPAPLAVLVFARAAALAARFHGRGYRLLVSGSLLFQLQVPFQLLFV